jgi:hypothetical protein
MLLLHVSEDGTPIKFMFSKKAIKIDEIFTVDLTLCSNRQINGEDFINFRGFLKRYDLYIYINEVEHL